MFIFIPLPLLVYFFAPPAKQKAAITLPYLPNSESVAKQKQLLIRVLAVLLWLLLIVSSARPVWYGAPIQNQPKHRDMMLVVDLSGSMDMEDMQYQGEYIDRLTAVKHVLSDFIQKRVGDRLGLVLFADNAYLQTPLTLDRSTVQSQLQQTVLGLVGQKTAIGEGIGLATKTFIDSDAPQRVMILLSDGSNNAGVLDPIKAAQIAKKYQTTIYTIGIGAGEMVVKQFFINRKVNTAKDLDEDTLTKVAEITGGRYFRARDQQELEQIYAQIDQLEPISTVKQVWRPQSEWFSYPLAMAFIISLVLIILKRHYG